MSRVSSLKTVDVLATLIIQNGYKALSQAIVKIYILAMAARTNITKREGKVKR